MKSFALTRYAFALILVTLGVALLTACGSGGAPQTNAAPDSSNGGNAPTTSSSSSSSSGSGQPVFATNTPAPTGIIVQDQSIEGGTVTVDAVDSDRNAWLVIRADKEGQPGTVLGHIAVTAGHQENLVVEVDTTQATPTLYAIIHVDAAPLGEFNYPGGYDIAYKVNNQPVVSTFQATGGLP